MSTTALGAQLAVLSLVHHARCRSWVCSIGPRWFFLCYSELTLTSSLHRIATDLCAYSIVVPVLPFRLEALGYPKEELSSLTSYLLISYSAGLVVFTPPIAYVTRRLNRGLRAPLLGGLVALIASQILFMLVRPYWAMVSGLCGLELLVD